jgi:acetoacetyl-CoA synthetase
MPTNVLLNGSLNSQKQSKESPLWAPPNPHGTRTFRFRDTVNKKYSLALSSYEHLYHWSVDNIADFWSTVWDETGVIGFKGSHVVDPAASPADNPLWFVNAQLNWAENMLRNRSDSHTALVSVSTYSVTPLFFPQACPIDPSRAVEPTFDNPNPSVRKVTYRQLYDLVADIVSALLLVPIQPGDRVASYSSNCLVIIFHFLAFYFIFSSVPGKCGVLLGHCSAWRNMGLSIFH